MPTIVEYGGAVDRLELLGVGGVAQPRHHAGVVGVGHLEGIGEWLAGLVGERILAAVPEKSAHRPVVRIHAEGELGAQVGHRRRVAHARQLQIDATRLYREAVRGGESAREIVASLAGLASTATRSTAATARGAWNRGAGEGIEANIGDGRVA